MHRRGVRRGHPAAHAQSDRLRRHHLDEPRLVVVCLVAVDVHAEAFVRRERKGELDRLLAIFARQLEVRDRAHDIDAEVDGPTHQVLAPVEGHDPLLGKRNQLEADLVAYLLAQLDQGAHGLQLRIAHVDVRTDELDAVGELPAEHGAHPLLDVVDGQALDPVGPDRDALEQRAGLVVSRLADGQHRVEVDVRLDQRGGDERSAEVDGLPRLGLQLADHPVPDPDVPGLELPRQARPAEQQIQHSTEC